jgi:aspartate aminotransferase
MASTFVPSGNVSQLRESATIAVSQKAKALKSRGRNIIDLGAGEPDFETPQFIRQAAKEALDAGATKYTSVEGIAPLRERIAASASALAGLRHPVDAREVVVSTGSKQALFNACFALFGAGDEVLIPTPAWTSYYEMVELARATAVVVDGAATNGLKVSAKDLEQRATPKTRGLMLNSPCNPTGAVYDREELAAILRLAADRGWWVISDEIYRQIHYVEEAPSVLEVAPSRDNLVVVDGMAKTYAMTGWRIGWAVAPPHVARTLTALQSHTTSNATTVAQHAALAAFDHPAEASQAITTMVGEYRRRRDAALAVLATEPEIEFVRPDGTFYLFIDVRDTAAGNGDAGSAFASRLLDEAGVAVVPGSAFRAPGWVRVSYAAPQSDVVQGIRRVVELWKALRSSITIAS